MFVTSNAELSFAFSTVTVPVNAKVAAGDLLGFWVTGSDFAPYCHMEYDTKIFAGGIGGKAPGKLFVQGAGQNSWRGIDGKTSPIYERPGKGVKFFATVE
jgi:hypothetical protein